MRFGLPNTLEVQMRGWATVCGSSRWAGRVAGLVDSPAQPAPEPSLPQLLPRVSDGGDGTGPSRRRCPLAA